LRGTKSADIPAEQPIKFDLAISLKAAKSRDLTAPAPLLATADESNNDVPCDSAECLLLAQSGHHDRGNPCLLSGVKRTSLTREWRTFYG
jgi:hypothetical protein